MKPVYRVLKSDGNYIGELSSMDECVNIHKLHLSDPSITLIEFFKMLKVLEKNNKLPTLPYDLDSMIEYYEENI